MHTIISCPTCRKKLRVPANKRIYFNCVGCGTLIHLSNGVITSTRERIELDPQRKDGGNYKRRSSQQANRQSQTTTRSLFWTTVSKHTKWGLLASVVLVIGLLAYQLSQVDHRYYADIIKTQNAEKIERYLRGYPKGIYKAQVSRLRDSLVFEQVYQEQQESCDLNSCDCSELKKLTQRNFYYNRQLVASTYEDCLLRNADYRTSFKALNTYREAFPKGRYLDSIRRISDQLWMQLRQQYTQRISTQKVTTKARRFFQQLLDFGQANTQSAIRVNFGYELALKDWEDYSEDAYGFLDMMTEMNNEEQNANYPKPSTSPPPSIRNYFRSNNDDLQQIIVNALQNRLDSVFTPNPFQLQRISTADTTDKAPTILIDYKIETLADQMGEITIPTLYVQQRSVGLENVSNELEVELRRLITRSKQGEDVTIELQDLQKKILAEEIANNPHGLFQGYLLATSIDWNMQFNIPKTETSYAFQTVSRPNNSFSNIQSNQDAYRRMMESTFVNYAVQLAEGFGI